jgi:hypothetical protein
MPYLIQATAPSGDPRSATAPDRQEALAIAVELASNGHTGIRILGEGRIYLPKDLALAIINDEPNA